MRIRSFMREQREIRGLSLRDAADQLGIARGELSMFERGHSIPRDDQIERLRPVYGLPFRWWPAGVAAALYPDIRTCDGCGRELDPSASRRRRYHREACRSLARRATRSDDPRP